MLILIMPAVPRKGREISEKPGIEGKREKHWEHRCLGRKGFKEENQRNHEGYVKRRKGEEVRIILV